MKGDIRDCGSIGCVWLRLLSAVTLCCMFGIARAVVAETRTPFEFAPVESPADGNPCAAAVICDSSSFSFPACRQEASNAFGSGGHYLYRWDKKLETPLPLLAIAAVVAQSYSAAGCIGWATGSVEVANVGGARPEATIAVLSNKYAGFFHQAGSFFGLINSEGMPGSICSWSASHSLSRYRKSRLRSQITVRGSIIRPIATT